MQKKKLKRNLLEWGILLGIVAVVYLGGWQTEVIGRAQQGLLLSGLFSPEPADEVNGKQKADYSLELRNQAGELVKLEDLKGKVVFMNLWASWCPPCVAEMPGIDALARRLKDKEVVFLMVSLDKDFQKATSFRERKDFFFDVHQLASDLPEMYHTRSIPATFVLSASGELAYSHKGMADYDTPEFEEFLLSLQE